MLRLPKVNDLVNCPPDRGAPAYIGYITHVDTVVNTNINGVKYVWCTVHHRQSHNKAVWPSHRLGYTIA